MNAQFRARAKGGSLAHIPIRDGNLKFAVCWLIELKNFCSCQALFQFLKTKLSSGCHFSMAHCFSNYWMQFFLRHQV
jgi:hypothetical protein